MIFSILRCLSFSRGYRYILSEQIRATNNSFMKPRIHQNLCYINQHRFCFKRYFSICSFLFSNNGEPNGSNDDQDSFLKDSQFDDLTNRLYKHPDMGHNVLLIQPRVKYGGNRERKSESELKLSEAVALVNTLPNWKVVEKHILPVVSLDSKLIFGKGNLEKLKLIIQQNIAISAVFIGIDILTAAQNSKLEEFFKIPVFDRYQIILQIFHDHAHTKEAKLQLALAEIPYLRVKLSSYSRTRDTFIGIEHVGGDGETYMEMRRRLLNERENKLKKSLEKVRNQREFLRKSENRSSFPVVAVVGYTNCGKTTLIKSLTNDNRLSPQDKLFATLDVTLHMGMLPSNQKVFFIDTVGFISDVPTSLIQSFRSTLEEITLADLVIHVQDISHPDVESQKKTVLKTLQDLDLSPKLLDSIVEVSNKIDLLENLPIDEYPNSVYISATKGTGLPELMEVLEQKLYENTGHSVKLLRVSNGGQEYCWLLKEAAIRDAMVDPDDANYLIVEVVISSPNLAKFKYMYGDLTVSVESLSNSNSKGE